jgi:hypothetical protein
MEENKTKWKDSTLGKITDIWIEEALKQQRIIDGHEDYYVLFGLSSENKDEYQSDLERVKNLGCNVYRNAMKFFYKEDNSWETINTFICLFKENDEVKAKLYKFAKVYAKYLYANYYRLYYNEECVNAYHKKGAK